MRRALPHVFDDLATCISDLVVAAMRRPSDREATLLPHARILAARLAMLAAHPRDVMELVDTAVSHADSCTAWQATEEECARLVLIALLAELCLVYRREALETLVTAPTGDR
jgi:hypothetical protein